MKDRVTRMLAGAALVVSLASYVTGSIGAHAAGRTTGIVIPVKSFKTDCDSVISGGTDCALIGTSVVNSGDIINGTVSGVDIQDSSVSTADIGTGQVQSSDLALYAVLNQNIAINGVTDANIAPNSVSSSDIAQLHSTDLAWVSDAFDGHWSGNVPTSQSRSIGVAPGGTSLTTTQKNFDTTQSKADGTKADNAGAWGDCTVGGGLHPSPCIVVPADCFCGVGLNVLWGGTSVGTLQSQIYVYPAAGGGPIPHNLAGSANQYTNANALPANSDGERIQQSSAFLDLKAGDKIVIGVLQLGDASSVTATVDFSIVQS
ncbi:MAG: hypothetical protein ACJ77A_07605 [Actinomycetota bacterium]